MAGITKRVTRLSDGRELFYFDDADTSLPPERPADTRPRSGLPWCKLSTLVLTCYASTTYRT